MKQFIMLTMADERTEPVLSEYPDLETLNREARASREPYKVGLFIDDKGLFFVETIPTPEFPRPLKGQRPFPLCFVELGDRESANIVASYSEELRSTRDGAADAYGDSVPWPVISIDIVNGKVSACLATFPSD